MRRFRAETHADQVVSRAVIRVLTTGESSWVQRVRVVRTTGPGREIDQSRRLRSQLAVALRQPAMPEHVQMEARCAVQVASKVDSFLLLVPDADKPLERDGTRSQTNRYAGVVEPVSGETEAAPEAKSYPASGRRAFVLCWNRRFDPVQGRGAFAAVIAGKIKNHTARQHHCAIASMSTRRSTRTSYNMVRLVMQVPQRVRCFLRVFSPAAGGRFR